MATAPEQRGTGHGRATVTRCCDLAHARGGTLAWCNARVESIPFYEALGWHVIGPEFEVATIGPHRIAELELA